MLVLNILNLYSTFHQLTGGPIILLDTRIGTYIHCIYACIGILNDMGMH